MFDLFVGCFGLNGPLRQYFSLYRAVGASSRERRKKMREIERCKKHSQCHDVYFNSDSVSFHAVCLLNCLEIRFKVGLYSYACVLLAYILTVQGT